MNLYSLKNRLGLALEDLLHRNQKISYAQEFELTKQWGLWPDRTNNPLTSEPRRYWSQSDEDGILSKIFGRINQHSHTFIEFGCGDGLENNTLALLAKGWRGSWIDGIELPFRLPSNQKKLNFQKSWITIENVVELMKSAMTFLEETRIALLSIDLDGNDYHFLQKILEENSVFEVIVLEYNARFPVGADWVMTYDPKHIWAGDDYFGASLSAFNRMLKEFGYFLVACSVQGSNAFFVNEKHKPLFEDIQLSEESIYQPPHHYLVRQWPLKACPQTVLQMLEG